jgi:hypothetical protein
MIGLLFNFFLIALLAPAFYAFVYEGVLFLASVFSFEATKWFFGGIVLSLFVYVPFLHGNIGFVEHLLHEFEHAALPFLFTFKLPRRLEVDPEEGSVVYVAYGGCALVALAPYYLPLLTVFFLGLKALASVALSLLDAPIPQFLAVILDLLIGATLMFHLLCTVQEFRLSQPDIKRSGRIASIIAVLFLSFMFVLLSVAVVTESYTDLVDYGKAALATTQDAYQAVLDFAQTHVLPMVEGWIQTFKDLFCLQCTPTPTP